MNMQQSAVPDCDWPVRARLTEVSPAPTSVGIGSSVLSSVSDQRGLERFARRIGDPTKTAVSAPPI